MSTDTDVAEREKQTKQDMAARQRQQENYQQKQDATAKWQRMVQEQEQEQQWQEQEAAAVQQQQQLQQENDRQQQENDRRRQQEYAAVQQQQQLQLVIMPQDNTSHRHQTAKQKQQQKTLERKEDMILTSATSSKDKREDAVNLKRNAATGVQVTFESNFAVDILCNGQQILQCDADKPVTGGFTVGAIVRFSGKDKTYTEYTVRNTLVGVWHRSDPLPVIDLPPDPLAVIDLPPASYPPARMTRSSSKRSARPWLGNQDVSFESVESFDSFDKDDDLDLNSNSTSSIDPIGTLEEAYKHLVDLKLYLDNHNS